MTVDDIHSSAASYAVGALPAAEVAEFEAHLAGCSQCQADVAQFASVTTALSASVAADPPARLRSQVLSAIADTPQEPAGRHAAAPAGGAPDHDPGTTDTPTADVVPLRRSRRDKALAVLAAAAVLAAVAFGGWALKSRNDALDEARAATAQSRQIVAVATAPDVEHATANVSGGGTATVLRSKSADAALLVAANLPTLPDGKTYEAWTIDGGGAAPVPAGTFQSSGAHTAVELPPAAVTTSTIAVTVEPAGGSDAPTTQPIVALTM